MSITHLQAARDAAFADFTAAKKGKCKKTLAQAEAALKAASKELTAAKAAADPDFVTPERLAETQARAMAALKAREAAQAAERAAEKQQAADIREWELHVNTCNCRYNGTPAQNARGHLTAVFNRLRADNVIDEDGEFSYTFLSFYS